MVPMYVAKMQNIHPGICTNILPQRLLAGVGSTRSSSPHARNMFIGVRPPASVPAQGWVKYQQERPRDPSWIRTGTGAQAAWC